MISPIVPLHLIQYHIILSLHIRVGHRYLMPTTTNIVGILSLFSHTVPVFGASNLLFALIPTFLSAFLVFG